MNKRVIMMLGLAATTLLKGTVKMPWTALYKQLYGERERCHHEHKKSIFFSQPKTIPFTQLVLSWNGERPQEGSVEFYMRARVVKGSKIFWEPWYKVALWSANEQRSFHGKGRYSEQKYVRLELIPGVIGEGFEVKVVGAGNACKNVHAIFVCASHLEHLKKHTDMRLFEPLSTVRIHGIKPKSQRLIDHPRGDALCSPTSLSMVLEYLTQEPINELETAHGVYDSGLDVYGSWPFNAAYAYERAHKKYFWYVTRLDSFVQLHRYLTKNIPVQVSILGPIKGGKAPYRRGHHMVVVGYDAAHKKVICLDPAAVSLDEVTIPYDLQEFLKAWDRSYHLAYIPSLRE